MSVTRVTTEARPKAGTNLAESSAIQEKARGMAVSLAEQYPQD